MQARIMNTRNAAPQPCRPYAFQPPTRACKIAAVGFTPTNELDTLHDKAHLEQDVMNFFMVIYSCFIPL